MMTQLTLTSFTANLSCPVFIVVAVVKSVLFNAKRDLIL